MLDSLLNGDWLGGSAGKLTVHERPKALVRVRSAKPLFALTVNGFTVIDGEEVVRVVPGTPGKTTSLPPRTWQQIAALLSAADGCLPEVVSHRNFQ